MTMTAVAVQQHGAHHQQHSRQSHHSSNMSSPHHSRPQSYSSGPAHMRQEPPIQNGTSGPMNPRPTVSNDPVQVVNGQRTSQMDMDSRGASTTSAMTANNGESSSRRSLPPLRPNSAPRTAADSSQDDSEIDKSRRKPRPRPPLRSKSDFGPRGEEVESPEAEDWQGWGARHGFEGNYISEEYVSQLANVGCSFLNV